MKSLSQFPLDSKLCTNIQIPQKLVFVHFHSPKNLRSLHACDFGKVNDSHNPWFLTLDQPDASNNLRCPELFWETLWSETSQSQQREQTHWDQFYKLLNGILNARSISSKKMGSMPGKYWHMVPLTIILTALECSRVDLSFWLRFTAAFVHTFEQLFVAAFVCSICAWLLCMALWGGKKQEPRPFILNGAGLSWC